MPNIIHLLTLVSLCGGLSSATKEAVYSPGNWTFDNCIVVSFNMSFTMYPNSTNLTESSVIDLYPNATVNREKSICGNDSQTISFEWKYPNVNGTFLSQSMNISFSKNTTSQTYGLERIVGDFYLGEWNSTEKINKTEIDVIHTYWVRLDSGSLGGLLSVPINRSYLCVDPGELALYASYRDDKGADYHLKKNGTLNSKNVKFDAFRNKEASKGKWQMPLNCVENRINDVVPIVVGSALAILVVIVLVAYIIGRKRPRSGYLAV